MGTGPARPGFSLGPRMQIEKAGATVIFVALHEKLIVACRNS